MADTPDLGSGSARIRGSSPLARTNISKQNEGFVDICTDFARNSARPADRRVKFPVTIRHRASKAKIYRLPEDSILSPRLIIPTARAERGIARSFFAAQEIYYDPSLMKPMQIRAIKNLRPEFIVRALYAANGVDIFKGRRRRPIQEVIIICVALKRNYGFEANRIICAGGQNRVVSASPEAVDLVRIAFVVAQWFAAQFPARLFTMFSCQQ